MLDRLYLDTARLGRMSPRAQRAHIDFVRVAGEEGCSLYWERFLRRGFETWPARMQQRYAGLADWHGLHELRRSLAALAGVTDAQQVLLANRSAELVRLAARLLFRHSRRVLVTDLTWPSYANILREECRRARRHMTRVPLRRLILHDGASLTRVVHRIAAAYRQQTCDGLFLPGVSHDGIRLPARMICRALRQIRRPRFVVVDGAQAFCHVPVDLRKNWCDVYITGCHKWLGGHIPMGLAFLPHAASYRVVNRSLARMLRSGRVHDPLLAFTWQLGRKHQPRYSETVNLVSLFSCRASVAEWLERPHRIQRNFRRQLANAHQLAVAATDTGWDALRPSPCFRSGILLLRAHDRALQTPLPETLRAQFHGLGIVVTGYPGGIIRLSMPVRPWKGREIHRLCTALHKSSRPHIHSTHTKSRVDWSMVLEPLPRVCGSRLTVPAFVAASHRAYTSALTPSVGQERRVHQRQTRSLFTRYEAGHPPTLATHYGRWQIC